MMYIILVIAFLILGGIFKLWGFLIRGVVFITILAWIINAIFN